MEGGHRACGADSSVTGTSSPLCCETFPGANISYHQLSGSLLFYTRVQYWYGTHNVLWSVWGSLPFFFFLSLPYLRQVRLVWIWLQTDVKVCVMGRCHFIDFDFIVQSLEVAAQTFTSSVEWRLSVVCVVLSCHCRCLGFLRNSCWWLWTPDFQVQQSSLSYLMSAHPVSTREAARRLWRRYESWYVENDHVDFQLKQLKNSYHFYWC